MRMYPKCKVCTGMELKGLFEPFFDRILPYEGVQSLCSQHNGYDGMIFLIDEIHLEYNSLESKGIPSSVFTEISQLRKQRILIVGTSQVFSRIAKPFREQINTIVSCRCLFGRLQINDIIDGDTVREKNGQVYGTTVRKQYMIHSPKLYDSFDTYQKFRRYGKEWVNYGC